MSVHVEISERFYPVIGTTWRQVQRVMALTGPTRGGTTYPAHTDWQLTYTFEAQADRGGPPWKTASIAVRLEVVLILPRLHLPTQNRVDPAFEHRWTELVEELACHERWHERIARAAAHGVHDVLVEMAPEDTAAALMARAHAVASAALDRARAFERAFDEHTPLTDVCERLALRSPAPA